MIQANNTGKGQSVINQDQGAENGGEMHSGAENKNLIET